MLDRSHHFPHLRRFVSVGLLLKQNVWATVARYLIIYVRKPDSIRPGPYAGHANTRKFRASIELTIKFQVQIITLVQLSRSFWLCDRLTPFLKKARHLLPK